MIGLSTSQRLYIKEGRSFFLLICKICPMLKDFLVTFEIFLYAFL